MNSRIALFCAAVVSATSCFAAYYYKSADGHNEWTYLPSWYTDAARTTQAKTLPSGDQVIIPVGEDVLMSGVITSATHDVSIGTGTGGFARLTMTNGATFKPGFNCYYIGKDVGCTGVLHVASGGKVYGVSNGGLQNFYIGHNGYGIITNQGSVFTREQSVIGNNAGSYGKYVHDGGTWSRCYNGKVLCVGNMGVGEIEVLSGTLDPNAPEVLLGGLTDVPSVITVRSGAKLNIGRLSVGGYIGSYGNTIWKSLDGWGRVVLDGGTLYSTWDTTPNIRLGAMTGSVVRAVSDQKQFGELRGHGTVGGTEKSIRIAIGRGLIEADGGTLDLNAVSLITNALAPYGACLGKLSAVNGGDIRFPRRSFSTAAKSLVLGGTHSSAVPDIVGSVCVSVSGAAASGEKVIRGGLVANDLFSFPPEHLAQTEGKVIGCWRFGLFTDTTTWSATKAANFAAATVQFKYDPSDLTDGEKQIYVYRKSDAGWSVVGRAAPNADGLITTQNFAPRTGADFNIGEFVLVHQIRPGVVVLLR